MCGILGLLKDNVNDNEISLLKKGLSNIEHRGPDGFGEYFNNNLYLGHRRLSIIDVSDSAKQPMLSDNKKYYIVFNGEIYNYKELAKELKINTSSDTKLLLEGFVKLGFDFFNKIRGIYSFAIYDLSKKEIYLVRDRAGVKPLYYSVVNNSICFGSEIKSIKPLIDTKLSVNHSAISDFLNLGFCVEPSTIYNEIHALSPGSVLTYNLERKKIKISSFGLYDFENINSFSFNENKERTNYLLDIATNRNLISDVPLSIALSGGIDSSLIYGYANSNNKVKGITVKMDDKSFDESHVATSFSNFLKAPHKIINLHFDDKIELLDRLLLHFDQPFADSSLIPFYFLNKEARKYSKVLIGGDSGDELHNGYLGFSVLPFLLNTKSFNFSINQIINFAKIFCNNSNYRTLTKLQNLYKQSSLKDTLFLWHSWFPTSNELTPLNAFKKSSFSPSINFFNELNYPKDINSAIIMNYFRARMQSDFLRKSDMMSMINSVEFRVPMLDEDLTQFSLSIPSSQKSSLFKSKKILRSIHSDMYRGLNSNLKKQGFTIPLDLWLGKNNIEYIIDFLLRKDGIVISYINEEYINILKESLVENKNRKFISRASAYQRLLQLYALQIWYINK